MPEGLTLYVVRHGQTDWNAERRYQGQADIPLNDKGRRQAQRNGDTLAGLNLNLEKLDFVASPLGRARETMEIVRQSLGLDPANYRLDPALKELSYGHWEGILQSDLPTTDPDGVAARALDPLTWRPRGGESYADLLIRTTTWLATVSRDSVIAAHGGTMRTLQALHGDLPHHQIPTLDAPQDKILVLHTASGSAEWL